MSQPAYNPVRRAPVADEDAIARMHAKLAAKLKLQVAAAEHVLADAQVASPLSRPLARALEWLAPAPGAHGYYSACRRYSICDVTISGVTSWEAWKLAGGGAWFRQLEVGRRSEAEARTAAQRDSEKGV